MKTINYPRHRKAKEAKTWERSCQMCREEFTAPSPFVRTCQKCKGTENYKTGDYGV